MPESFLSPTLVTKLLSKLDSQQNKPGLYLVSTPIGNILDMSFRAIHILRQAKYIFAEDTRQSKKLLNFYEINTRLISCHEYNEIESSKILTNDDIYALISDAGTPVISDPGYRVVNWCIENGINVIPVPGASSLVSALTASGLPTDAFTFYGFLPPKAQAKKTFLNKICDNDSTMIFFESPKKIVATLSCMLDMLGDRYCCVCREITKIFEEFKRGRLSELIEYFSVEKPVGEFVLVVAGNEKKDFDENSVFKELKKTLQKKTLKDSVQEISDKFCINKNIVYKKALELKRK